jgi:uncharacterized membrane protein HdeD (DUF308 family)
MTLSELLARNWWVLLLRGVVAILFGVMALLLPGITLLVLVVLYGAYAAVDGVLALVAAFRGGENVSRGWLVFVGVAGLAAAAATLFYPGITALVLVIFIGAWSIARGIGEIVLAVRLRKEIEHEWLLALGGVASVLFGAVLVIAPGAGALALVWLIGSFSIALGVLLVVLSFRLRSRRGMLTPAHAR